MGKTIQGYRRAFRRKAFRCKAFRCKAFRRFWLLSPALRRLDGSFGT